MLRKIGIALIALLLVIVLAAAAGIAWLRESNIPDRDRDIGDAAVLAMLDDEVSVKRDRLGVPYIYAETLADALRVQGFVTAQDRLSQMLLTRELIHGRLSEQIGEAGLRSDTLIRVMGLSRMGSVWAAQLESPSRELHEWFLEGVNAYIATQADEFPLAVRLSGQPPAPFTLEDMTTQYLFLAFNSTGNWRTEVLSQALVDHLGAEKAAEISMLTVNPDDESEWASDYSLAENSLPTGGPGFFPSCPSLRTAPTAGPHRPGGRRAVRRSWPTTRTSTCAACPHLASGGPDHAGMAGGGRRRRRSAGTGGRPVQPRGLGHNQRLFRCRRPVYRTGRSRPTGILPGRGTVRSLPDRGGDHPRARPQRAGRLPRAALDDSPYAARPGHIRSRPDRRRRPPVFAALEHDREYRHAGGNRTRHARARYV